jgi:hypothetical protein
MISFKSSRIWGPVTGDVSAEVHFVWLSVSASNARVHVVLLNVVLVHVSRTQSVHHRLLHRLSTCRPACLPIFLPI